MYAKKISTDALRFALILAFVRLGPEILLNNRWNDALEVGEMYLGATLGYRRFSAPNNYEWSNRYVNLKTLDSLIMDRTTSLRSQLAHLRNYGEHQNDIYAYYNEQKAGKSSTSEAGTSGNDSADVLRSQSNVTGESWVSHHDENRIVESLDNLHASSVVDLSREDMDLIEILWKQDIDLGVSREAFSFYDNHQSEKAKEEAEFSKPSEVKTVVNSDPDHHKGKDLDFESSDSALFNQWEGLSYTVDNETGEYIIQDQKLDEGDQNLPGELSLFSGDAFDNLSQSLFHSANESSDFDFTKISLDENETLSQPLDNFLTNLDDLFAEVEKLEGNVLKTEEDNCNLDEGSEMYPSMEDYWQDISTTLPPSVMGVSFPGSVPIVPRPIRAYPAPAPENHTDVPSSSELLPRANDTFQGALLQNATLPSRSPDINSTFGYLPSVLGPTSLGCAVASSIATLTNDTDPMPDVSSVLNGTYGLDLPAMLHPNETSAVASTNESLMSDLLMVEDLQLMGTTAASSVGNSDDVSCHNLVIRNDNMELSSDSVASSMSGNISSISDCSENRQTNLEDLSTAEYVGKDSMYTSLKYPLHPPYTSAGYRQTDTPTHSDNFGFSTPFRNDYRHYMQHNHSYHLPFTNCNTSPKPVTRDKSKLCRSDDDIHNRDEKRAKALKLPISINDIINLGIDEFNEKLSKFELTEPQLTLIRDIRRRGKNKVAAQNCRKRKMDQISNLQQALDFLETERLQLESERAQLLHQRRNVRDKYSQLCQFVIQSTSPHNAIPNVFPSNTNDSNSATFAGSNPTTSDSSKSEETVFNQGVRAKRKIEKKKFDFP